MLERYSTRLEEIVEIRTKELEQEKQRSEDLLLKILPKRISDQLKVGSYVRAEQFDNVSIYFSDIVDFTKVTSYFVRATTSSTSITSRLFLTS